MSRSTQTGIEAYRQTVTPHRAVKIQTLTSTEPTSNQCQNWRRSLLKLREIKWEGEGATSTCQLVYQPTNAKQKASYSKIPRLNQPSVSPGIQLLLFWQPIPSLPIPQDCDQSTTRLICTIPVQRRIILSSTRRCQLNNNFHNIKCKNI